MTQFVPQIPALEHCYEVKLGALGLFGAVLGNFLEVSGLSVEYETHEYAEGGRNDFVYRHRGRMKQSNLTLKRGLTSTAVLLDWVMQRAPLDQPQDLQIIFKTADNEVLRTFGFIYAVPVRWTGPNASIGANTVATESLEIAHRGFTPRMWED
jgi:phage tail-like protein